MSDNMDLNKGGVKYDGEKPRWDLLPYDALDEVAKVFTFGANKYRDRNWEVGMRWGRPFAATQRHMSAWMQGESVDQETGLNHLAHAICELAFLLAYELRGVGTDDRPQESEALQVRQHVLGAVPFKGTEFRVRNTTKVGVTDREDVPATPPNHDPHPMEVTTVYTGTPQSGWDFPQKDEPELMVTWGHGEALFHPRNPQCNPASCVSADEYVRGTATLLYSPEAEARQHAFHAYLARYS